MERYPITSLLPRKESRLVCTLAMLHKGWLVIIHRHLSFHVSLLKPWIRLFDVGGGGEEGVKCWFFFKAFMWLSDHGAINSSMV